jgi:hypothetical protein
MIYGKYTQAQWDALTAEQQVAAVTEYRVGIWRTDWLDAAKLPHSMSRLQTARGY